MAWVMIYMYVMYSWPISYAVIEIVYYNKLPYNVLYGDHIPLSRVKTPLLQCTRSTIGSSLSPDTRKNVLLCRRRTWCTDLIFQLLKVGGNHGPQQCLQRPAINGHIYRSCTAASESKSPLCPQGPVSMGTPIGNEAGPPTTDQDINPAFLVQSLQPNIYAACIVVTVAATIAVALRILCRRLAKAYLWWGTYVLELIPTISD